MLTKICAHSFSSISHVTCKVVWSIVSFENWFHGVATGWMAHTLGNMSARCGAAALLVTLECPLPCLKALRWHVLGVRHPWKQEQRLTETPHGAPSPLIERT